MACKIGMIILAAMAPLGAEEKGRDWGFGAQASFAAPIGGFSGAAGSGLGLSAFGERRLSGRHEIRFGIGYVAFGENELRFGADGEKNDEISLDATSLACDYIYRLKSREAGAYALVGAGYREMGIFRKSSPSSSSTHGSLSAGAGHNFNKHFGVEAVYVFTNAKLAFLPPYYLEATKRLHVHYAQAGAHYRF